MTPLENDRWQGVITLHDEAPHEFTVEAWIDMFRGWQHEFAAKFAAGVTDLTTEALEGAAMIEAAAHRAQDGADAARLTELSELIRTSENAQIDALAHSPELETLMAVYPDRSTATQYAPPPRVIVDRPATRTAAWYEFFPRSASGSATHGSTLREVLPRVDDAQSDGV